MRSGEMWHVKSRPQPSLQALLQLLTGMMLIKRRVRSVFLEMAFMPLIPVC